MEKLKWTKNIVGSILEIRRGEEQIGSVRWENIWGAKAQAMINGRLFMLNREFFLSKLEIYDANDQSLLGMVMTNLFTPRCDVVINGKRFELEIQNFWQSRWSWKFNGMEIITYSTGDFLSKGKGEIHLHTTLNEEVEILLLLGLFVRNQFVLIVLLVVLFLLLLF